MKGVLLIRPWIYDFAAYDLWMQPMGLLYVASFLEKKGFEIHYLDCLDPYNDFCNGKIKRVEDGRGKFYREEINKPLILEKIPRRYCRYGLPEELIINKLIELKKIDAILITTMMTYWYLGVKRTVEICRELFPSTPIILGGIYTTLMPEHANKTMYPDLLIKGPLEINNNKILSFLLKDINNNEKIDAELYPAWHYVNNLRYLPILTSYGCPFKCSYCASKLLYPIYKQRDHDKVIEEIIFIKNKYKIENIVFYDDALLVNAKNHFIKIMNGLNKNKVKAKFHTPNGLNARLIDEEVAELIYNMGFKTICVSLESSDDKRNLLLGNKVSRKDFKKAMQLLFKAGYKQGDIDVYLMIGMPEQNNKEIWEGIKYVSEIGGITKLSLYSAIPGTTEFYKLPKSIQNKLNEEPLLQNNSIFSHYFGYLSLSEYEEIKLYAEELNNKIKRGA